MRGPWRAKFEHVCRLIRQEKALPEPCRSKQPWNRACRRIRDRWLSNAIRCKAEIERRRAFGADRVLRFEAVPPEPFDPGPMPKNLEDALYRPLRQYTDEDLREIANRLVDSDPEGGIDLEGHELPKRPGSEGRIGGSVRVCT